MRTRRQVLSVMCTRKKKSLRIKYFANCTRIRNVGHVLPVNNAHFISFRFDFCVNIYSTPASHLYFYPSPHFWQSTTPSSSCFRSIFCNNDFCSTCSASKYFGSFFFVPFPHEQFIYSHRWKVHVFIHLGIGMNGFMNRVSTVECSDYNCHFKTGFIIPSADTIPF